MDPPLWHWSFLRGVTYFCGIALARIFLFFFQKYNNKITNLKTSVGHLQEYILNYPAGLFFLRTDH